MLVNVERDGPVAVVTAIVYLTKQRLGTTWDATGRRSCNQPRP